MSIFSLSAKAWSPYVAGIVIGLLQIPAFLIVETALGVSSSYVTIGTLAASWVDPSILDLDYVARHVAATAKNWWQVALVAGIAIGAFLSAKLSSARRQTISPIWSRVLLERWRPWQADMGHDVDGDFGPPETAQAPSHRIAPAE